MYFSGGSPTITNCTMSGNSSQEGGGIYCFNSSPTLTNTIIAFSEDGEAIYCSDAESQPILNCCDVYGYEGGDWVDCIADQLGVNGNFSADPLFCDVVNGDLTLNANSPLLPGNHPNGHDCGLIGAWGDGGGATPVLDRTWGEIKEQFRE